MIVDFIVILAAHFFCFVIDRVLSMMACEDQYSPLITSNQPSIIQYKNQCSEVPSSPITKISIDCNSMVPDFPISSLKKSIETIHGYAHPQTTTTRRISPKHLSIAAISHQLTIRTVLQNRLGFISNMMCFLGLLGTILMIIENEITFVNTNNRDTNISWFIKLIISITTIILLALIIYYHRLNLNFYAAQNSLDDWRTGLTIKRMVLILLEILICAIHPMPRYFPHNWVSNHKEIPLNSTKSNLFTSPSYIATDIALGLPMFARLYLICRCIMFHSDLVRSVPPKSLSSLNKVSINFIFLLKTYLEQWPARCLIIFCCLIFFIGSWSIRACDYKPTVAKHISIFDSMWLFIITFTTVGYGDLIPSTYCGRTVASIIALIGIFSSALLISVVAQKLALTRWEKYVHHFVSDIELTRECREQSANVIKFAIKIWYLKRKNHIRSFQYFKTQRILFQSIHILRKVKHKQRKLNDNCLDLIQLINLQRHTNIKIKKITKEMMNMKFTMEKMEEKFVNINNTMNHIQCTLDILLNKTIN